jgi:hypothetical protein
MAWAIEDNGLGDQVIGGLVDWLSGADFTGR